MCWGRLMSSQLQVSENPHYAILSSELQRLWGYAEEDRDFVVGITQKMAAEGRVSHYVTNVAVALDGSRARFTTWYSTSLSGAGFNSRPRSFGDARLE